jgi:hypothetical protein
MTEAAHDRFNCKLNRNQNTGSKGSLTVYEAVLLRIGEEIQTLYWNGSLQETVNLARTIAIKCEADLFVLLSTPTAALKCAWKKPLTLTIGSDLGLPNGSTDGVPDHQRAKNLKT